MARTHAGCARGHVGRLAVPSRRLAEPAPRRRHDGHARLGWCDRRVRLVALRAVLRRRRRHGAAPRVLAHRRPRHGVEHDLPRGRRRSDDVHPGWAVLRGPSEASLWRRDACVARARSQGRRRGARWARATHRDRRPPGRRPFRGPAGREDPDRRRRGGRPIGHRPVAAHRRAGAGRGRSGRRGDRGDDQCWGPPRRSGDGGRRRHEARPDRQARSRRPVGQGARTAVGRPRRRYLRTDRDRHRRGDPRLLARFGRGPDSRVHGSRCRAHHRLPVRARPGDADGADGRHRTRRSARRDHQGTGSARVDARRRHDRARQDRNRHDRRDVADRRRARRGRRPLRPVASRRRRRGRLRAPDRQGDRRRRAGGGARVARRGELRQRAGTRRDRGRRRARGRRRPRAVPRRLVDRARRVTRRRRNGRPRPPDVPRSPSAGTASPAG